MFRSVHILAITTMLLAVAQQPLFATDHSKHFRQIVDTTLASHPGAVGIMACVISADGNTWSYAAGIADKTTQTPLMANQPVNIASNTKTYISAAIFRLQEEKDLNVTDAIGKHLSLRTRNGMSAVGYDLNAIKLTHLLSHTSGIDDYVTEDYFNFVDKNRQYHWTRDEQIDLAMKAGKRLGASGYTFRYADVNYLLLAEIIENITRKPFYVAVCELLRYKEVHLNHTWFAELESSPRNVGPLVHQYWNKYPWDTYDLHPSWDLFGGGGILATPQDMARFYKQLFEGNIIHDKQLLAAMCTVPPCKSHTNYAMGVRILKIAGLTAYYHGGFWGTDVIYFPELKMSMAIVILEHSERDISAGICRAIVEVIKKDT